MPDDIRNDILQDTTSANPTAPTLGLSNDLNEWDHGLSPAIIDRFVDSDLRGWSAADEILLQIIRSNPASGTHKARLTAAKKALLGIMPVGRPKQDDSALLFELVLRRAFSQGITSDQPLTAEELFSVVDPETKKRMNAQQKISFLSRIQQKFKDESLAIYTSFVTRSHPKQRERWEKTQQVIRLLTDLKIIIGSK